MRKDNQKKPRALREERGEESRRRRVAPYGFVEGVYRGTLTLLGEMSQVPDSQKLFGALVHRLADVQDAAAASRFVGGVRDRRFAFALSSVLPEGYLPTPKAYLLRRALCVGVNAKVAYDNIKRMDYARLERIAALIRDPGAIAKEPPVAGYVRLTAGQQVHVNALGDAQENNHIFSTLRTVCGIGDEKITTFTFWMQTGDATMPALLSRAIGHVFTLGRRSSQGYNLFELSGFAKVEDIPRRAQPTYLNLGMLLPSDIDYTDGRSALALFTSERRPYGRREGAWQDAANRGHYISFVAPGSIVVTKPRGGQEGPAYAGKCVAAPTAARDEIVFGNAFLYPLEVI